MRLILLILFIFCGTTAHAWGSKSEESEKPILIRYRQRPPYIEKKWGELSGKCGDNVIKAFKKAKISFQTMETPFFRQLVEFQSGDAEVCSIAWLKNSEREEYLKFSDPICDDGPWVIVGHKGTISPDIKSVESLFKNPDLKVVRRTKFSFGEDLDEKIKTHKTHLVSIENPEFKQVFDIVQAGRADYTLLPEFEFYELVKKQKISERDFVVLRPDDLKGPHLRYMICSKGIPDAVIKKFNKAVSSINQ